MERRLNTAVCMLVLMVATAGCTTAEPVAGGREALAPAGSNAAFVSNTMPTAMFPGEKRVVQIVVQNTGTTPGFNDWTTSYRVRSTGAWFGWPQNFVTATVATGASATFNFIVIAPSAPGTYGFSARMTAPDGTAFGPALGVSVAVSAATTPLWGCTYEPTLSTVPTTLGPAENATATIVVRNTGSQTWLSSGFALYSTDSPLNLWGGNTTGLTSTVAPGATATFNVALKAPATGGAYTLNRQMRDIRGLGAGAVGLFRADSCVALVVTVGGTPALDASLVSQNLPATLAPSEPRTVNITLQNTGTETWVTPSTFVLYSQNSPVNLYGNTLVALASTTAPGASATFTFNIVAPATAGAYSQRWQLRKLSGANAGYFGPLLDVPLTVDGAAIPQYGATLVSQTIPTPITAGRPATFQVVVSNSGTQTWSNPAVFLNSQNTPVGLWGVTNANLGVSETVAPSGNKTFSFTVTAPAMAGTYTSTWRMLHSTAGYFGPVITTSGIVVTLCGNTTVDAGEQCDDGNLVNGDGCSAICQAEQRLIDLASNAADRTLTGSANGAQLSPVTIGDVTGDALPEVMVSQMGSPIGVPFRNAGGTIYGYAGGAGFFTGTTTAIPTGSLFQIAGAEAGDALGAVSAGGIIVADVTGDGLTDLIVSAGGGDGVANGRLGAGEVYVLAGAAALGTAGLIDLNASPTALSATVIGRSAGDATQVLAAGDLTGDSIADLVLGASFDDTNGVDAGAVFIVPGGASLTGIVDLATAPGIVVLLGAAAGDRLGMAGAVGDVGSTSAADLVLGAPFAAPGGRTRTGSAYLLYGPVSAGRSMSGAVGSPTGPDAVWLGRNAFDAFGGALAIGQVVGSSQRDLIVGALQWNRTPGVQVGADLIFAGPITSATYDLSGAATPTTVIRGADQYDDTGTSVAVGDLNGDGYDDIVVIASAADGPGNARTLAGESSIVFGSASLPALIDLQITIPRFLMYGAASNDLMGRHPQSVAVRDIDGDGRADFCVGSYRGATGALSVPGRIDCIKSAF